MDVNERCQSPSCWAASEPHKVHPSGTRTRVPSNSNSSHPFANPTAISDKELMESLPAIGTMSDYDLSRYRNRLGMPDELPRWRRQALSNVATEYRKRGYFVTDLIGGLKNDR